MTSVAVTELLAGLDPRTRELLDRRQRVGGARRRGWLVRRALAAGDVAGLILAFCVAEAVFVRFGSHEMARELIVFVLTLPVWIVAAKLYGLYEKDEERTDHTTPDDFAGVFHLVTVGTFLFDALSHGTGWVHPEFEKLFVFWLAGVCAVSGCRVLARTFCRRRLSYLQNTLIVGAGDVGQLVGRKLLQHSEYGLNLVGFVDDSPREMRDDLAHLAVLGGLEQLTNMVDLLDVERVIVAFSLSGHEEIVEVVRALKDVDVQVDVVPRFFDVIGPNVDIHSVEGLPLVGLPPARISRSSRLIKRAIDVVVSGAVLMVAAPFFAYAAIRIRRDSPGPVFFRQERLGVGMRRFTVLKFRTMKLSVDPDDHRTYIHQIMSAGAAPTSNGLYKLGQDDKVTQFGRWLRRTSLDELPQLINVLRGEMSLVGPRPCIDYETDAFEPHHFERFLVPAGITGLWQVTARARSTFAEALDMDVAYARSWSLGLDLSLLVKTPIQLLRGRATA